MATGGQPSTRPSRSSHGPFPDLRTIRPATSSRTWSPSIPTTPWTRWPRRSPFTRWTAGSRDRPRASGYDVLLDGAVVAPATTLGELGLVPLCVAGRAVPCLTTASPQIADADDLWDGEMEPRELDGREILLIRLDGAVPRLRRPVPASGHAAGGRPARRHVADLRRARVGIRRQDRPGHQPALRVPDPLRGPRRRRPGPRQPQGERWPDGRSRDRRRDLARP